MNNDAPWTYIYLAGGMKSGWQDKVIKALDSPRICWLDPRTHNFTEELDYTAWDLRAVAKSDYVFAYLEKDNPGGHGLMLEIGYAIDALHEIIFVEDEGDERTRFYGMARAAAKKSFKDLDKAIAHMKKQLKRCYE